MELTPTSKREDVEIKHEKTPESFEDIFSLDGESEEALKARIEKWKGLVRIIVHPYFDDYKHEDLEKPPLPGSYKKTEKSEQIKKVLIKMLDIDQGSTPPIIIMEEHSHLENLFWKVAGNKKSGAINNPYIIQTRENTSVPIGTGEYVNYNNIPQAWYQLVLRLEELGIKNILLGGLFLKVRKNETSEGLHTTMAACVGEVYEHLKDYFKVELSSLTSPDSRADAN